MKIHKRHLLRLLPVLDLFLLPFSYLSSLLLKLIRRLRIRNLPLHRDLFRKVGIFPITSHYYDPSFQPVSASILATPRPLPGINLNVDHQLDFLQQLNHTHELTLDLFPEYKTEASRFLP